MRRRSKVRVCISLGIAIVVMALALVVYCNAIANRVNVSGVMLDAETGEPLSNSKVIVTVRDYGVFDRNPKKFSTTTDEAGQFAVSANVDFAISQIHLEACSSRNKYVYQEVSNGRHTLLADQPPEWSAESPWLQYDTFSGRWSGEVHNQLDAPATANKTRQGESPSPE